MTTEAIIQILLSALTAIGLFFTGLSYLLSRKTYKKQYEYNQKQKALEIAEQMAVLISTDISSLLEPFMSGDCKEFMDEYFSNIPNAVFQYNDLFEMISKPKLAKYQTPDELFRSYAICLGNFYKNVLKSNGVPDKELNESINKEINKYLNLQNSTLNKIEAISMYLYLGIADEEVIYPSVHQVFLQFIKIASIRIALSNKTSFDEYYKYTIHMYHMWNKRQIKHTKECEEKSSIGDREIEIKKFKR